MDIVEQAARDCGYPYLRMHSGPGHDAQYVADILPTSMIFVSSEEGHSHCELAHTSAEACARGVNVLIQTLLAIDRAMDSKAVMAPLRGKARTDERNRRPV